MDTNRSRINPATLKVLTWNANGISPKKQELDHFLAEHQVDVALIQETFLKPCHRFTMSNYIIYRDDRDRAPRGGTLILVKKNINHAQPIKPVLHVTEATMVSVTMSNNSQLQLVSVYQQNGITHPIDPRDYHSLLGDDQKRILIGGDFNAKHVTWGNHSSNPNGVAIKALQDHLMFSLIQPDEPTHFGTGRSDVLDIFLSKNLELMHDIEVFHELSSDHLPVILTVGNIQNPQDSISRNFINWQQYEDYLRTSTGSIPKLNDAQDIERAVSKITQDIQ